MLVTAAALAVAPAAADARWLGSLMRGTPNANYGCEAALVLGPVGGVELQRTNQTSCTYKHGGYLYGSRPGSIVPGNGRIGRIRVKVGRNPARLRLTILTGSSRTTADGGEINGTYTCCTARFIGKPFRPKANTTTTRRVAVAVRDHRDPGLHTTDVVAISAVGPGTLPLLVRNDVGSYTPGTPISTGFWPMTRRGEPRSSDGYTMPGIDVLFGWDFRPR
jgi:hypothetical protein